MLAYGKSASVAVAVASYLASVHGRAMPASATEISRERRISFPHVAKILGILKTRGIVIGQRGSSGGFRLARAPEDVSLADLVEPFEQSRASFSCPFGPDWCGKGAPCPVHHVLAGLQESNLATLRATRLSGFAGEAGLPVRRPAGRSRAKETSR